MENVQSTDADVKPPSRGRLVAEIKGQLNDTGIQLSLLNHRVSARLDLRSVDLDCLALVTRHGPMSPSALARQTGLHRATLTGVLDRLERGGWIVRERDPGDRRGVLLRALRDRHPELFRLLAGMNNAMSEILEGYEPHELALLADFLRRAADAGREAASELAGD